MTCAVLPRSLGVLATALLLATTATTASAQSAAPAQPRAPQPAPRRARFRQCAVVSGTSIVGVRLGMTRAEVTALGFALTVEADDGAFSSAPGTYWADGPLHLAFDTRDRVQAVALHIRRCGVVTVDGRRIPHRWYLQHIARAIAGCQHSHVMVTCGTPAAPFYFADHEINDDITVELQRPSAADSR